MIVSTYEPGTRCWVQDDKEGWIGAEVESKDIDGSIVKLHLKLENDTNLEFQTSLSEIESNSENLPPLRNPPILESPEDLTSLSFLNEPAVLHAIRVRYSHLNIYTYSGIVLIATNPFQRVDNLYTPDIIQAYSGSSRGELEPHLFAIAEDAYRCMVRDKRNQTIVVSGESGAGKTVSAKYIMRYFATVEDPDHPKKNPTVASASALGGGHGTEALSETEEQILATNPIMEAFGNAKTTRNDNSSRFGKYLEILFDKDVEIIGAKIRTYLLERSRLVFQPSTERNYHIFYQICRGSNETERQEWGITSVDDFFYLNQGGDSIIQDVNDSEEFNVTKDALETVGITSETQSQIFKVLSALLHVGNIEITNTRTSALLSSDEPALAKACELLGLNPDLFAKWIVKKQITTRSEKIVSTLNHAQATVVRDSVAKYVYSTIFDWLVQVINKDLSPPHLEDKVASFIGVLDIYGFEHFKLNSFEQFCINYANEKLQQEFNQHVFKLEQDEYVNEEIEWTFIDFSDNQPCISLIEGKLGILSLLDEESRLPSGSDESLIDKLYQNFDNKPAGKDYFKKPRFGKSAFIVKHYAMDVEYEVEGFIEKNRDSVPEELVEVLSNTTNEFLGSVFKLKAEAVTAAAEAAAATAAASTKPGPMKAANRKPTLGSIFKGSLIELMSTINSTNVHYIRCIKPNDEKAAWKFDGPMVLSQLRACGVLETIRISCAGFPTRWTYEEFASRYYMLTPSSEWTGASIQKLCDNILKKCITTEDRYQMGKTKIFFRAGMLAYLEKLRSDRLNDCAIVIQRMLRMYHNRTRYLEIRKSIIQLQSLSRGFVARLRFENMRRNKAAIKIQSKWRGYHQQTEYNKTHASVVELQRIIRGYNLRKSILEKRYNTAAVTIQKNWRGYREQRNFQDKRKKIVLVQSLVRRRGAVRELQKLKVEAKSVNHYKEVQYKLENKVVELTQSLATRREDNKTLQNKIDLLQSQLGQWQKKHTEAQDRMVELGQESEETKSSLLKEIDTIQGSLAQVQKDYNTSLNRLSVLNEENKRLQEELMAKEAAIAESAKTIQNFEANHASLNETIEQLKADLENATKIHSTAANMAPSLTPLRSINGSGTAPMAGSKKRNLKRRSLANLNSGVSNKGSGFMEPGYSPRPASIALPNSSPMNGFEPSHSRKLSSSTNASGMSMGLNEEIERLLEDEKLLDSEVLQGLIFGLKIPLPSATEKITHKEILFPANIINLITSEMWRLGFVKESEKFLSKVLPAIQEAVLKYRGEDIINPGAFWLSNVHEIWSFMCLAESNILENDKIVEDVGEYEYQEYTRLVNVAKSDLESLEYNIYHTWMKEIKKILDKMVVPAMVLSQSLPGFYTPENTRFLSKMFSSGNSTITMDDLLSLFNKVYKAMDAYYLSPMFMKQPILEMLKLVGVKSFNDLLMRRGFSSWKRGLQINYNITRIEEWCKAHGLTEGTLKLEHILQSTKLLQLKKNTLDDIAIIYDICWTLTPAQIQKLINHYLSADYEPPISPEILNAVASKVRTDTDTQQKTLLLEVVSLDDSGPFEIMDPRPLKRIESYIPGWLPVPNLKRLAEMTATVNSQAAELHQAAANSELDHAQEGDIGVQRDVLGESPLGEDDESPLGEQYPLDDGEEEEGTDETSVAL